MDTPHTCRSFIYLASIWFSLKDRGENIDLMTEQVRWTLFLPLMGWVTRDKIFDLTEVMMIIISAPHWIVAKVR